MTNDKPTYESWGIYEILAPGPAYPLRVVAPSLMRALAVGLDKEVSLDRGAPLVAWDVTSSFLATEHSRALHTWALLGERLEGRVEFDEEHGWARIEDR